MRLPAAGGGISKTAPLRLVNRAATEKGRKSNLLPSLSQTQTYWDTQLQSYLAHFTTTIDQIRPLARTTVHSSSNTIIVMVCNWGHVELVLNWLCGARARGLTASLRHTLIWATDAKTRDTLTAAGLTVVYMDNMEMPERAAGHYADATFGKMMLAKVWCVQQLVWLGYNVLFQDADVMWYKDPLEYWVAATAGDEGAYDMYFQDEYVC